jgi:DNA-binding winged helix-turn-helix (wHTH) protein
MMIRIRFGTFKLDERCWVLENAGETVALRPKAFELLLHLARHRDRVVRREELIKVVWGGTRVGAGSLAGLVNEVRQALSDSGGRGDAIRTIHGRGYQFVAPAVDLDLVERDASPADWPAGLAPSTSGFDSVVREAIGRASGVGWVGLVAEGAASRRALSEVETLSRSSGFSSVAWAAPPRASLTPGRLVTDLLSALVEARSLTEVAQALPLPARIWLEASDPVQRPGVRAAHAARLPGGLSALAAGLAQCAARTPILLSVDQLDRAGEDYAGELMRLLRDLETAPILVVVTLGGTSGDAAAASAVRSRVLGADGAGFRLLPTAGFDSRPVRSAAARAALERWRKVWALEALPHDLEAALLAHLCGEHVLAIPGDHDRSASSLSAASRGAEASSPRPETPLAEGVPPRPAVRRVRAAREVGPARSGSPGRI